MRDINFIFRSYNVIIIANVIGLLFLSNASFTMTWQDKASTRMALTCKQYFDGELILEAHLRARIDRQYQNLSDFEIDFYSYNEENEILLGKAITNSNGKAVLSLDNSDNLLTDEEGYFTVSALFQGNDQYKDSDDESLFKRAFIELTPEESENGYSLMARAYTIDGDIENPLVDLELYFQIPRMFSNLTLLSDYTDEDGMLELDIPTDLPGDEDGNLSLIVSIPDTDDYGNIESKIVKKWGIPLQKTELATGELWTPDPPLWMLITFSVLMILAWGHFIIIIYKLYLVNKIGKSTLNN